MSLSQYVQKIMGGAQTAPLAASQNISAEDAEKPILQTADGRPVEGSSVGLPGFTPIVVGNFTHTLSNGQKACKWGVRDDFFEVAIVNGQPAWQPVRIGGLMDGQLPVAKRIGGNGYCVNDEGWNQLIIDNTAAGFIAQFTNGPPVFSQDCGNGKIRVFTKDGKARCINDITKSDVAKNDTRCAVPWQKRSVVAVQSLDKSKPKVNGKYPKRIDPVTKKAMDPVYSFRCKTLTKDGKAIYIPKEMRQSIKPNRGCAPYHQRRFKNSANFQQGVEDGSGRCTYIPTQDRRTALRDLTPAQRLNRRLQTAQFKAMKESQQTLQGAWAPGTVGYKGT